MSLPILVSLQDCADWHKTVEPFLPELYDLPQRILDTGGSPSALGWLYLRTNPLVTGFAISLILGGVFLLVSEMNLNYSQVDRMWSILPNLYIIHFAVWAHLVGVPTNRINLIAAFSTIWSVGRPFRCCERTYGLTPFASQIRLTYNYWRRGGYQVGSEDYRWCVTSDHHYP